MTHLASKSRNKFITYNGETKTLSQWSREIGISYSVLYARIFQYNWSVEQAFTKPVSRALYACKGRVQSLSYWCCQLATSRFTIYSRIKSGWSLEEALEIPLYAKCKNRILVTYKNETKYLADWARELGIGRQTLYARIYCLGWSVEKAFTTPTNGKTLAKKLSLKELLLLK